MATVGPYYFNSVTHQPGFIPPYDWSNPNNAAGAPDGSYASANIRVGTSSEKLLFTQWGGIQYLPPVVNITSILIELYAEKGVAANAAITDHFTTFSWEPLVRTSGGNFLYNGAIDNTFGFLLELEFDSGGFGTAPVNIDSARMTVQYDGFFDNGYGLSKKQRKFKSTRNRQTKIVSQVRFNG